MPCTDFLRDRGGSPPLLGETFVAGADQASARGVPAVRQRDQWPNLPIVVCRLGRRTKKWQLFVASLHRVLLAHRSNGRLHYIQQLIELDFTHSALPNVGWRTVAKLVFFLVERIAQIVAIWLLWLPIS
jgi:hypothetical protein